MNKLLYILIMWLGCLSAFAQTDGYDPTNPPNPEVPETDTKTYYTLTVVSSPNGIGSFNIASGKYVVGESIWLYAYSHDACTFQKWIDEEGNTLSTSYGFYYTMPAKNVTLTAVYTYNPSSPSNPEVIKPVKKYNLVIKSIPEAGGTFSPNGSATFIEGEKMRLYAYTNPGFKFLRWQNEAGDTIATDQSYYLTMPANDVTLYGVYEYVPASPSNPGKNSWDDYLREVIVDDFTPGNVTSAIYDVIGGSGNKSQVEQIIVAGVVNSNDMQLANQFTNCTYLDLSRTTGVSCVPNYCFSGRDKLVEVILPASITQIQYYAFNNCSALQSLVCHAAVPPTLGSNVFAGTPETMVVYVPESSVDLYKEADGWKNMKIEKIQSNIHSVQLSLPGNCSDGRYKNMTIELINIHSGQKYKYVITDRLNYIFNNLVRRSMFNAYLKNNAGIVLAEIDNIYVNESDLVLTFENPKTIENVKLRVNAGGKDATKECKVRWFDNNGNYLSEGAVLPGQVEGYSVKASVTLPQQLAMQYYLPNDTVYEVKASDNEVVMMLDALPMLTLKGKITDSKTNESLNGVLVTVTQTVNGTYSKSTTATTDNKGNYEMTVYNAPASITCAVADYVSSNLELTEDMLAAPDAGTLNVAMKSVTGVTINTAFTFTKSAHEGVEPEVQKHYADYNNISYTILDKTQGRDVTKFSVQYPNIVLLEEVPVGDVLQITAKSKTGSFNEVTVEGTVDEDNNVSVTFPLVELGQLHSSFMTTENSEVVGLLYDSNGNLVRKSDYQLVNMTMTDIPDGTYTYIMMGKSEFFNNISELSGFAAAGLRPLYDYIQREVTIKSGLVTRLKLGAVPFFDESQLYYTADNTSFAANKTSIVAGNVLTFTAKLYFKDAFADKVTGKKLIFNLPEGTTFVDNSLLVGKVQAPYELEGNKLTVDVSAFNTDRVRFCVVPKVEGDFAPTAYVQFSLDGKSVTQPIGSAPYHVKNMSISVPESVKNPTFIISGTATPLSDVEIFDGSKMIGKTKAIANGYWSVECTLDNAFNLSEHEVYAKVLTKDGLELQTETVSCLYDVNMTEVKTITMSYLNEWNHQNISVVFDFETGKTSSNSYSFYQNTDFTFVADLSDNDPNKVKEVIIFVTTSNDEVRPLHAIYNNKLQKWVATSFFASGALPVNVAATVKIDKQFILDKAELTYMRNDIGEIIDGHEAAVNALNAITDNQGMEYTDEEFNQILTDNGLENYTLDTDNIQASVDGMSETDFRKKLDEEYAEFQKYHAELTPLIASLESLLAFSNGECSYTLPNGYTYQQTTASGLTAEQLVADGYQEYEYNDDSKVYVLVNETTVAYVDFARNISLRITHPANAAANRAEATEASFAERCKDAISKINEVIGYINDATNDLLSTAGQAEKNIRMAIEGIEFRLAKADVYIRNAEKLGMSDQVTKWKIERWFLRKNLFFAKDALKTSKGIFKRLMKAVPVVGYIATAADLIDKVNNLNAMYAQIPDPCYNDEEDAIVCKAQCGALLTSVTSLAIVDILGSFTSDAEIVSGIIGSVATAGTSLTATVWGLIQKALVKIGKFSLDCIIDREIDKLKFQILALECSTHDPNIFIWNQPLPPFRPVQPIIDPSGFVYEGVESNRIEGVMASVYYKETAYDDYGDLYEKIELWNAEEYDQKNPLFTDKEGMYAWDVPSGLWQVKFEKEGYQTAYSEWLPVPPPQLEVNIAMTQVAMPEVKSAKAYEDGVEIEFSKYMKPETLNKDNIYLKLDNGSNETLDTEATIELLNEEAANEGSDVKYASKIRVKPSVDLSVSEGEAYIIIGAAVESYAGVKMAEAYSQKLDIVKKITSIAVDENVNVGYEGSTEILIGALPGDASKGKTLNVKTASEMIASVEADGSTANEDGSMSVILDANGQAKIKVNGQLLGSTALLFSVEDADATAQAVVNVVDPAMLAPVENVKASRVNGSTVYSGQTVTLSCATDGATIYYTTDGSCPCEAATRIKYNGAPIAITGDITIKAMAVGISGNESETSEFAYSIKKVNGKIALVENWNWVSHNQAEAMSPEDFKQDYVERVLSQTAELFNDDKLGFVGNLGDVPATDAVKIHTKQATDIALGGEPFNPNVNENIIVLHQGWNWLGYPLDQTMSVGEALAHLDAEEGDRITYLGGGFAEFSNGAWTGTLETMSPGQGFLYKSVSGNSFLYNDAIVSKAKALYAKRLAVDVAPWSVDVHKYPNMMCVTAELFNGEAVVDGDNYYLGAFVGDECRGVAKYINGKYFLSVYGDKKATVNFVVVDKETGESYTVDETVDFNADVLGSVSAPYPIYIVTPTGINGITADAPSVKGIYNMMGQKVKSASRGGVYVINGRKSVVTKRNEHEYMK